LLKLELAIGDLLQSADEQPWLENMAGLSFSRGFAKSTVQAQEMKRGAARFVISLRLVFEFAPRLCALKNLKK
jgi:hypothetical protein